MKILSYIIVKYFNIAAGKSGVIFSPFSNLIAHDMSAYEGHQTGQLLLSIVFLGSFLNFSFVPFNVLRPVYVDEILKTDVEGMNYLGIGLILGIIAGGI